MEGVTGERARFEALYAAHHDAVLRYARRRVEPDAAPDVAAEVFVIAWRRLGDVPAHPLPWLYAVARRVCANQRRGAERRVRLVERVASLAVAGRSVEERPPSAVAAAFDRLGEADREVLALVAWEELSAKDAAVVLGCSVPAVTMRLHRARRRIRALLAEPDPHPTDQTEES